jgi:hypothetical protein
MSAFFRSWFTSTSLGQKGLDIPLFDRVFDIKQKLVTLLKAPIRKIQLFVGPHFAGNEIRVPDLRLSGQSVIRVSILPEWILRHYFRDLEDKSRVLSFPAPRELTFGSLAPRLLKENPIEVGYMWEGELLKRSTLLFAGTGRSRGVEGGDYVITIRKIRVEM